MSELIHLLRQMQFTLHTLVVARSGKPPTCYEAIKSNLLLTECSWNLNTLVVARLGKPLSRFVAINSLFATFADLHVRKRAMFADLHSYTHAYGSFVLLNEVITIVFGLHCLHAL